MSPKTTRDNEVFNAADVLLAECRRPGGPLHKPILLEPLDAVETILQQWLAEAAQFERQICTNLTTAEAVRRCAWDLGLWQAERTSRRIMHLEMRPGKLGHSGLLCQADLKGGANELSYTFDPIKVTCRACLRALLENANSDRISTEISHDES